MVVYGFATAPVIGRNHLLISSRFFSAKRGFAKIVKVPSKPMFRIFTFLLALPGIGHAQTANLYTKADPAARGE